MVNYLIEHGVCVYNSLKHQKTWEGYCRINSQVRDVKFMKYSGGMTGYNSEQIWCPLS